MATKSNEMCKIIMNISEEHVFTPPYQKTTTCTLVHASLCSVTPTASIVRLQNGKRRE
jgi:hypothetical protein